MKDVIRLEIGEPDMDTPLHIKEAAKKALDEGFTHYTPFSGFKDLREAIAEKVKAENGVEADPEREIIVTPGACCSVYCAILSMVNPKEEVLVPDPGWPHYDPCIKIAGGVPVHYPQLEENDFRVNPADLAIKVNENTKAILINSPNNPTGSVLSRKNLEDIAQIAKENDLIVISDEVYEKILYDDAEHVSIASLPSMRERTVTINALSKTYAMTGWRTGYAIAREEIIAQMAKLVLYTSTCTNSIAQRASITALKGSQNFVVEMVREYKRRRDFLVKRLNQIKGISCKLPKGAFYIFPNVRELNMSSLDCASYLLEHAKVSVVPGSGFGEHGEGYLRLSYATSIENLEKAMNRIEKALKNI
jgi:aspartate/methionine/tyrosine aminotransferase